MRTTRLPKSSFNITTLVVQLTIFVAAAIYVTAGILITVGYLSKAVCHQASVIKLYLWIWILVVDDGSSDPGRAGGGLASGAANNKDKDTRPANLMVAGIIFQLVSMMAGFCIVLRTRGLRTRGQCFVKGLRHVISVVFVYIRCIYNG
ncbi:hypothetical protein CEK25_011740 [Fusarium fujikuroi]|nr:hypothetical protein CEK25_011740 [Fusarium fujikuroi]